MALPGEKRKQVKRGFPTYREACAGLTMTLAHLGRGSSVEPARKGQAAEAASDIGTREPARTWSRGTLSTFLAANHEHRHHAVWLLHATTGLRRGEALGLAWSALDLDAGRAAGDAHAGRC